MTATSTCALDVERLSPTRIGRVRGSMRNGYTAGVICEKVRALCRAHPPSRPADEADAPDRSQGLAPVRRDLVERRARHRGRAVHRQGRQHGSETIWPYYYAGTMGLVQRDGINRLRNAMKYSRFMGTICVTLSDTGWIAGVGAKRGATCARSTSIRISS